LFLPDLKDSYDKLPKPMYNYATQGTAPPGSTFKPLSAIAGLQEGVITPKTIIYDRGIYTEVGDFKGRCWALDSGSTHGAVNVSKALQVSCNYFFFEVGNRLGYKKLGDWAAKFGLGRDSVTNARPATGIEIYERTGTVGSPISYKIRWINSAMKKITAEIAKPGNGGYILTEGTEEYKAIEEMMMDGYSMYEESKLKGIVGAKNIFNYITGDYKIRLEKLGITNEKAQKIILVGKQGSNGEVLVPGIKIFDSQASLPGDPLNTAIGQGQTSLTPLQMAQYIATLLNGGTRYKAHLVKKVLYSDGTIKREIEPEVLNKIDLNPEFVEEVKKGMRKVTEEGGTASNIFRNYPIETGGKTGTAQWNDSTDFQKQAGRAAYGWFIGFAPYEKPEIAVVAVVYDGGHGNYVGHAVKDVFDQYFKLNK
jgi:penicillin-binding protein 2